MKPPIWREVQRNNFTNIVNLLEFLQMSEENRKKILKGPRFVLNLPLRLAKKMAKNSLSDPLFRQFVPLKEEMQKTPGFEVDPVCDTSFRKTEKLLHKYKSRALLVTTSACAMHCRYCFRQNFPYETKEKSFSQELDYIRNDPTITEVILSGGDPLSLSNEMLQELIEDLNAIQHVERIRFHSRFPIGIPERIDEPFLKILKECQKQIFFIVHINHPLEIDLDVTSALKKIQMLGIPVLNQSVLLHEVNDKKEILLELSRKLINAGILPYYLHKLDPVQGASHFALSDTRGEELIQYLKENISGFGVPKLAKEEPGKPSKTY